MQKSPFCVLKQAFLRGKKACFAAVSASIK